MTELLQIKSLRCSKYKDTTRQTAMHPGSKCSSTMHRFANSANVGNRYTFASVDCMYKPAAKYVERHKQREADARLGKGEKSLQRASQPKVSGTVNTARISFHGCGLRTGQLNDDCSRPHPSTVAAAPYHPHTRPQDVLARLAYQRLLVNTYCTSDLCRPSGRARPTSASCDRRVFALTSSGACVDLPGFGRGCSDMSDQEDDQASRGSLR